MINEIFLITDYICAMKLRLEKGIVKFRLASSEIEKLSSEKFLEEKIFLSDNNQFAYALSIQDSIESCAVSFGNSSLAIIIPQQKAEKWINSNQIGIKETIVTENGDNIVLTLEEDLPPRKHKKK